MRLVRPLLHQTLSQPNLLLRLLPLLLDLFAPSHFFLDLLVQPLDLAFKFFAQGGDGG